MGLSDSYAFPGPFKPMDNQIRRWEFLLSHQYAFDLSETRTGKTATAIWACDYLMSQIGGSVLILAPLTTLSTVWEKHYGLICDAPERCCVLSGATSSRVAKVAGSDNLFFITNYECLLSDKFRQAVHTSDIHTIVVDEATAFKHFNSKRSKYMRELGFGRNVWGLTATPMPNSPMNAYGVARAIRPDYRESMSKFRDRTHIRKDMFTWVPKDNATDTAYEILQPSIRVKREECYAIPATTTERRLIRLGDKTEAAYKAMRRSAFLDLGKQGTISAPHEAALCNKLLQIAGGAAYTGTGSVEFEPGGRAAELLEVLESTRDKAVVFVPYTAQLELVKTLISKAGYSVCTLHGATKQKDRARTIDLFERTRHPHVIVADPRVLAHGVELSAAGVLVWWLPTYSNEIYQQALARPIARGMTKGVLNVQLCGTPEEKKIYDRLDKRESLQGVLLEALEGD